MPDAMGLNAGQVWFGVIVVLILAPGAVSLLEMYYTYRKSVLDSRSERDES